LPNVEAGGCVPAEILTAKTYNPRDGRIEGQHQRETSWRSKSLRVGTIPCLGASERTHHGDVAACSQLGQRGAEINPLPGVYSIRQVFGGQLPA